MGLLHNATELGHACMHACHDAWDVLIELLGVDALRVPIQGVVILKQNKWNGLDIDME